MIRTGFEDKLFQTIIVILAEITCIHKINPIIYYWSANGEKLIYRNIEDVNDCEHSYDVDIETRIISRN